MKSKRTKPLKTYEVQSDIVIIQSVSAHDEREAVELAEKLLTEELAQEGYMAHIETSFAEEE